MSTQVIGSVNELEGPVSIMRDGETRSLAAGDSIMAGDVITASDSGRASIILSNSYGEPIGNLLVAPTGSVIADTTLKNGQTALVFEALSDDGVTIANLDPDFAEMVELQGVEQAGAEGGMFGLFGGGLLAGGSLGAPPQQWARVRLVWVCLPLPVMMRVRARPIPRVVVLWTTTTMMAMVVLTTAVATPAVQQGRLWMPCWIQFWTLWQELLLWL